MSAINPASFASPTLGLQAPSGIGPGAVGVNRGSATGERRANAPQEQGNYPGTGQAGRGSTQPSFPAPYAADRGGALPSTYPVPNYPYNPYGAAFGNALARPNALPYAPGMMQSLDAYQNVFPQGADYGRGRFPAPQATGSQQEQMNPGLGSQTDWVGAFQGLSLNTR